MGWMGQFLAKLAGEEPVALTFVPSVPVKETADIPGLNQPITADDCYVELYLESLRLSRARRLATRFNAVVYSFVTIVREGEEAAQLAAVSKPSNLLELDDSSLDNVITISKRMMGPLAFRGNPVSLELGLFSVKSGNMLTPVLDYVARVSSTAGISYVSAVKPFLPLITEGMDLLAGQRKDTVLEVGLDTDATLTSGSVFAIINKPKGDIDNAQLMLASDGTLLYKGTPVDSGYAVFSIRPRPDNPDRGGIPDLKQRYADFKSAIRRGSARDARDAFASLRFAAIASPDLIQVDAEDLIKRAKEALNRAFPPGGKAGMQQEVVPETLAELW